VPVHLQHTHGSCIIAVTWADRGACGTVARAFLACGAALQAHAGIGYAALTGCVDADAGVIAAQAESCNRQQAATIQALSMINSCTIYQRASAPRTCWAAASIYGRIARLSRVHRAANCRGARALESSWRV
jgi:hypothetical protein